jgi:ribose transport system substrate-binding protein
MRPGSTNRRSRGVAVAAAAGAALTLLVVAAAGAGGPANVRVALVLPDFTQNAAILDMKKGAEGQAKKLGGVTVITTGSISAEGQVRAVENAIAADVDVIVYDTTDANALSPAILKANRAGIPTVCYASCAARGAHASKIIFDWKAIGRAEGVWLAKQLKAGAAKNGGTPVLGVVDTSKADGAVAQIYQGREGAIRAAGVKFTRKITPPTLWDRAKGLTYATDLLTANPRLDALTCNADSVALACWQAMKAAGRTDIPLSGANGDCVNLASVLKGEQDFSLILFLKSGAALAMDTGVKVARKQKYAKVGLVPIQGIDRATAQGILSGKRKVAAGLDTLQRLKAARAGCK